MDRRNFLRSILGVAAATALPSEVWPFRKIFLPAEPSFGTVTWAEYDATMREFDLGLSRALYPGRLYESAVMAVELEAFAKSIPNLIYKERVLYKYFKHDAEIRELARPLIPIQFAGGFSIVD